MTRNSLIEKKMRELQQLMYQEWVKDRMLQGPRGQGFSCLRYQQVYDLCCQAKADRKRTIFVDPSIA